MLELNVPLKFQVNDGITISQRDAVNPLFFKVALRVQIIFLMKKLATNYVLQVNEKLQQEASDLHGFLT